MKQVSDLPFCRSLLLLPLFIPLCAMGLVSMGMRSWLVLSIAGLAYGGIPYLIFTLLAWRWIRDKTRWQISAFGALSPLLFIPLQVVFMLCLYPFRDSPVVRVLGRFSLRDCFEISYFVLIVGYAYVCFGLLLWSSWISYHPDKSAKNALQPTGEDARD